MSEQITTIERRQFGHIYRHERSRFWWVRYRVDGKTYRESSGSTSLREAERLLARREVELGRGDFTPPDAKRLLFTDLAEMIRTDYQVKGRRSLGTLEQSLARLTATFGATRAVGITTDRVSEYERDLLDQGYARATINKDVATLRRAFTLAVQARRLPVSARPILSTPDPQNARQGFFEPEDFARVLAELPEALRPVMTFAYLTGWRTYTEILPLTWDRVDFQAGMIRLEPGTTKTGEGRMFPFDVLPELETLLTAQRDYTRRTERATGQIIPLVFHRHGKPIKSYAGAWRSACKRAASEKRGGLEIVSHPHLLERIPHDLRRTAVRNLVRAGVPERVAMQLTGHKTRSVFDRYDIVNEADLREGVAKLAASSRGTLGAHSGHTGVGGAQ